MLRSLIKASTAYALTWTGANKLIGWLPGGAHRPFVVGYHRVVEDIAAHAEISIPAMLISRRMLERHLDWIGRRFRFVSLDELGARLEGGWRFDKPVAAITFDDGYRDVYDHAYPLLKRKGIPAAMFVVTEHIGTSSPFIYDRLYLLLTRAFGARHLAPDDLISLILGLGIPLPAIDRFRHIASDPLKALSALLHALPQADVRRVIGALEDKVEIHESLLRELCPLNWDMLAEMQQAGMTIGSHTKTHVVLTNEPRNGVEEELWGSRQALERRLGILIKHFAYPDGKFDVAAVRAVAASGYRFGYTTCRHQDPFYPLLTIPRRLLWENSSLDALGSFSPAVMSCLVNQVFDFAAPCRQDHSRSMARIDGFAQGPSNTRPSRVSQG